MVPSTQLDSYHGMPYCKGGYSSGCLDHFVFSTITLRGLSSPAACIVCNKTPLKEPWKGTSALEVAQRDNKTHPLASSVKTVDFSKAVKADDAENPTFIWDKRIWALGYHQPNIVHSFEGQYKEFAHFLSCETSFSHDGGTEFGGVCGSTCSSFMESIRSPTLQLNKNNVLVQIVLFVLQVQTGGNGDWAQPLCSGGGPSIPEN